MIVRRGAHVQEARRGSSDLPMIWQSELLTHGRRSVVQVLPCSKRYCHDWTTCPFSHPSERSPVTVVLTGPHPGSTVMTFDDVCNGFGADRGWFHAGSVVQARRRGAGIHAFSTTLASRART